jgi:hypothetical protein
MSFARGACVGVRMWVPRKEWAIVLLATRGLGVFVENALLSIVRCGVNASLVEVVFPGNAECELASLAQRFGARPRILEHLVDIKSADIPATYVEYGSKEFFYVNQYRFPALRTIMAEGKCVIYADVDVAWFRNPLPYLSHVLDTFPCAFQTESIAVFPPLFCLGFFALADTPASLKLIDHFIARYAEPKRPMQPVFRDIVIENPEYLADIFPLPEGLFPNGLLYRALEAGDVPPVAMSGRLQPFIFHGNCTRGLDRKRCLLTHAGGWLVRENAQLGEPGRS